MMPATPLHAAGPTDADFEAAQDQVQALAELLQEEFELLKAPGEAERLDLLQTRKLELLQSLQSLSDRVAALPDKPAPWAAITDALSVCRETFRRNQALLVRQLDVVRQTLNALQSSDPAASVDLYDHLGHMSRRGGRRVYSEA